MFDGLEECFFLAVLSLQPILHILLIRNEIGTILLQLTQPLVQLFMNVLLLLQIIRHLLQHNLLRPQSLLLNHILSISLQVLQLVTNVLNLIRHLELLLALDLSLSLLVVQE